MKKYISDYVSDFEKELNVTLMNKEADRPLVDYVVDAWKSLEIVHNIKIMKWEYNDMESEIDINKHIFKREKNKKKKDRVDYKFINEDRYGCLTVWIEITIEETEPKSGKVTINKKIIKKSMLIPIQDDEGYFYIKGKRYFLIYQMVDKSTYTGSSRVTLKSLMPVSVKRDSIEKEDINDVMYKLPVYSVSVFKKEIPTILFYASDGMTHALDYLGVSNVMKFREDISEVNRDKNVIFQISSKCNLIVNKKMFNKHQYVQGVVGMILSTATNRLTMKDLNNKDFWIKKLSPVNNLDKGKDILVFFNRLMDETTKKILKLDDVNRKDVYALLRWMMMNFNELRMKDNLSLDNKRLRCNEYIASLLTQEFSKRLNRIITLSSKATMDNFKDIFKFSGDKIVCRRDRVIYRKNLSNCGELSLGSNYQTIVVI